eukprot:364896-Chlamydomonas_euryale.AAC.1
MSVCSLTPSTSSAALPFLPHDPRTHDPSLPHFPSCSCESYKFHERVQLDSITHNELGNPEALLSVAGRPDVGALTGWSVSQPGALQLLNLKVRDRAGRSVCKADKRGWGLQGKERGEAGRAAAARLHT